METQNMQKNVADEVEKVKTEQTVTAKRRCCYFREKISY